MFKDNLEGGEFIYYLRALVFTKKKGRFISFFHSLKIFSTLFK